MSNFIFILLLSIITFEGSNGSFMSQSQAGTIIFNDYGEISCDDLICPKNTFKCRIIRASIPQTRNMQITRTCLTDTDNVLIEDKKESLAPYEGFQAYAEADIHGNYIADGRPWNKEEQEKLKAEIAQRTQEIVYQTQLHTQQIHQQVNQMMYNLNNNLQNTFANIFGRR